MLWLDEIQGGIWQSNKDTQEAQKCMYPRVCCFVYVWVEGESHKPLVWWVGDRWLVGMVGRSHMNVDTF